MRVRHLNEIELQACLDRSRDADDSSRQDHELVEHLENCYPCREELELYSDLYGELADLPTVNLPRSFARKVTFSVPAFAYAGRIWRLRMVAAWSMALLAALVWPLLAINWRMLFYNISAWALPKTVAVETYCSRLLTDMAGWGAVSFSRLWSGFAGERLLSDWYLSTMSIRTWFESMATVDPDLLAWSILGLVVILVMSTLDNIVLLGHLKEQTRTHNH